MGKTQGSGLSGDWTGGKHRMQGILCPPQHPTCFQGEPRTPLASPPSWGFLPPSGPMPPRLPGRRWVPGMEKRGEALRGAELSRGAGTEQSDPHTQSGSCAGPPLPAPISPQSDGLPSPLFTLYPHFLFQLKGGGGKLMPAEVLATLKDTGTDIAPILQMWKLRPR